MQDYLVILVDTLKDEQIVRIILEALFTHSCMNPPAIRLTYLGMFTKALRCTIKSTKTGRVI